LRDIFDERIPLYERYGDLTVDCDDITPQAVAEAIVAQLQ